MPFPGGSGNPGHTTGGGGVPPPTSSGGTGSSGGGGGPIPAPGFSGWEVTQTPHGPVVVGAVTSTGQLIRPGGIWPGTGGKRLIVPANFNSHSPATVGGGGGVPSGGGGGGFPSSGGGGGVSPSGGTSTGGTTGTSASSSLWGVLSKMFPFITDFGNQLPTVSTGSTGSALEDIASVFGQIGALAGQFLRGVEILFTPTFWVRAVAFVIGLPVTTYGLIQLGRASSGGGTAMGITAVGAGLVLLFLAFHNLPSTVNSPGTLAGFLKQEIQGGAVLTAASVPYTTASIMEQPLSASAAATTAGP